MLTGEIRSQIDSIWNAFWSDGVSNPLEVIEQITYLLFLRRLDDFHTLEENKANRLKKPMERRIFSAEEHAKNNLPDVLMRWLRLRSAQGIVSRSLSEVEGSECDRARTEQSFCRAERRYYCQRLRPVHQPL